MNAYQRTMDLVAGKAIDRLPAMPIFMTWLARQIGRTYREYCFDHAVLVEGQHYLVDTFEIDCVSVISDAWREAADCGAELTVFEREPPGCTIRLLDDKARLASVALPDPLGGGRMTDRVQAVQQLHAAYAGRIPVMGWVEGPMAEACCLRGVNEMMFDLVDDPGFAADLMDFAAEVAIAFAVAQVKAGADIIGMGDAAASLCGPRFYESMVLAREQRVVKAIHDAGALARLHICGNTNSILAHMARTGCEIIDLDYPVVVANVRPSMGERPVVAGSFNPVTVLLEGTPAQVTGACRLCHEAFGSRHIVCAGCEVPMQTPMENVRAMFEYACRSQP